MTIVDMRLILLEVATCRRSDKDDIPALLTHSVGKDLQIAGIAVPGTIACLLLFLIVVSELADDIVALTDLRQYLVETQLGEKRCAGESALGIVGYHHTVVKPTGDHLSPRSPGLFFLIYHCAVATEEHRHCSSVGLDGDALHGGSRTTELKVEHIVPVLIGYLTLLQLDARLGINHRLMLVDDERYRLELTFLRCHKVRIVTTRLGTHNCLRGTFLGT